MRPERVQRDRDGQVTRYRAATVVAVAALISLGPAPARAASTEVCTDLRIGGHPSAPPFSWIGESGVLTGVSVEVARQAAEAVGLDVTIQSLPTWAEVVSAGRAGTIDVITAMFRSPDRTDDFLFDPNAIWLEDYATVFTRRGAGFEIDRIEDLADRRGVTVEAESFGAEFDAVAADLLDVTRVPSFEQMVRSVLDDPEIDYGVFMRWSLITGLPDVGIDPEQISILPYVVISEPVYMAMSLRSPCLVHAAALYDALQDLLENGTKDRLVGQYLRLWTDIGN